nr:glycosyltransferase [Parahaliea mediterranea]
MQRTLANAAYLPENGWRPLVLSAAPRAYPRTSDNQLNDIPEGTVVERAWAMDTARHLKVRGWYPGWLALPDRWVGWAVGGLVCGWRLLRRYRPSIIWSTYPIATAHLIGLGLHKVSGLPWVVDFRDSMTEDDYPPEPRKRRVYRWIEKRAMRHCSLAVFTTPSAAAMYRERYPELPQDRFLVIPNGYDHRIFDEVEGDVAASPEPEPSRGNCLLLLHSGVIYPQERDPEPFFTALSMLKREGLIDAGSVRVRLRAPGHRSVFEPMLGRLDIEDMVELAPALPYREALGELLRADGLLVFQAANCNHQIPAKIYEYFRARKPVLALTDSAGDTASALRQAGIDSIVPLDNAQAIASGLVEFVARLRDRTAGIAAEEAVAQSSRKAGVAKLARAMNALVDTRSRPG